MTGPTHETRGDSPGHTPPKEAPAEPALPTAPPRPARLRSDVFGTNTALLEAAGISDLKRLSSLDRALRPDALRSIEDACERLKLEPGIIPLVAALTVHGFATINSCEGHQRSPERQYAPWVMIGNPVEPYQYIGVRERMQEAIARNGDREGATPQLLKEYLAICRECEPNGLTPDYRSWMEDNRRIRWQLCDLLSAYNSSVPPERCCALIGEYGGYVMLLAALDSGKRTLREVWDGGSGSLEELQQKQQALKSLAQFLREYEPRR